MLYLCYLCRFKPLRDHLRGFLIAAWAGDKIAEFSFPKISFHFSLRPWFFFVSPAYAGKSPAAAYACPGTQDHPRVCGEKLYTPCVIAPSVGSPPRMRGKGYDVVSRLCRVRITPACAGKSEQCGGTGTTDWDHPRMCGEKCHSRLSAASALGSPPHVRGKVPSICENLERMGITPACAGKRLKRSRSTVPPVAIVPLFPSVCNKPVVSDGSPAGRDAPLFLPAENAVPASPAYNLRSL